MMHITLLLGGSPAGASRSDLGPLIYPQIEQHIASKLGVGMGDYGQV